jgi:hypothetical protein
MNISNILITIGISIVLIGILTKLGFPHIPGDIVYKKDGLTIYAPIATSIIISIVLTLLIQLMRK